MAGSDALDWVNSPSVTVFRGPPFVDVMSRALCSHADALLLKPMNSWVQSFFNG